MSELRLESYVMPAGNLGPASPLSNLWYDTTNLVTKKVPGPDLTQEDVKYFGYGYHNGSLPYFSQDNYDRGRNPRSFKAAVLENENIRATFLLELGGRLWSVYHKKLKRELLHVNPVFQPANLGLRNAWFSGGSEWNFCWIGHTPFTCDPLFAAKTQLDDGTPVLRMWEWERVRQMAFQIDAYLPDGASVLYVRVRLANMDDRTVPIYWWSNIAVPEAPGVRVLVPSSSFYSFDYHSTDKQTLVLPGYPYREKDSIDYSYPVNSPRAGDRFFKLPAGNLPWIAAADSQGKAFFHASSRRLIGRKLWVFGQHPGGKKWQDFLNTPGHPYIEIQGGLAHTQMECLPLPPRTEWDWVEAYGGVDVDPKAVHGQDWPKAWQTTQKEIEKQVTLDHMEKELARTADMAQQPPKEIIQTASGWGALEIRRRLKAGTNLGVSESLVFPAGTIGPEQAPWVELLEKGYISETDPAVPPPSWMIQDEWRQMLEESIRSGKSDHWLGWCHLGVMYMGQDRAAEARSAWEKSIALRPSAWACRNLAALAGLEKKTEESARLYVQAVKLCTSMWQLAQEAGAALLEAGQVKQWLDLVETLPAATRGHSHLRLLEAKAALELNQVERAGRLLMQEDLTLTNVREGDGGPASIWFTYQAKRVAAAEGVAVDDALMERVKKEFPPPAHLDYRLG